MDLGIKGRRAIVCASSKGLGRACAVALANEGVHVTLTARGAEAPRNTSTLQSTIGCAHANWVGWRDDERWQPRQRFRRNDASGATQAEPIALHERIDRGANEGAKRGVDRHRWRGADPRREVADIIAAKFVRLQLD